MDLFFDIVVVLLAFGCANETPTRQTDIWSWAPSSEEDMTRRWKLMISHQIFDCYEEMRIKSPKRAHWKAKSWEGTAVPDIDPLAGRMWTGERGSRGEAGVETGWDFRKWLLETWLEILCYFNNLFSCICLRRLNVNVRSMKQGQLLIYLYQVKENAGHILCNFYKWRSRQQHWKQQLSIYQE